MFTFITWKIRDECSPAFVNCAKIVLPALAKAQRCLLWIFLLEMKFYGALQYLSSIFFNKAPFLPHS
jgi:hypothetical protein